MPLETRTTVREVELLSVLMEQWEILHMELCEDNWPHRGDCQVPLPGAVSHEEAVDALEELHSIDP